MLLGGTGETRERLVGDDILKLRNLVFQPGKEGQFIWRSGGSCLGHLLSSIDNDRDGKNRK